MKLSKNFLNTLKPFIEQMDKEETRALYKDRKIARGDKVKDINKRYRWDLFYSVPRNVRLELLDKESETVANFNDSHIDTVLRKLVKNIE